MGLLTFTEAKSLSLKNSLDRLRGEMGEAGEWLSHSSLTNPLSLTRIKGHEIL